MSYTDTVEFEPITWNEAKALFPCVEQHITKSPPSRTIQFGIDDTSRLVAYSKPHDITYGYIPERGWKKVDSIYPGMIPYVLNTYE